jgi:hypothetical protein
MKIDSLPNHHIVVLAVALLGGDASFTDREDVAVKANELAPGRFNWRKYASYIDLDAVGVALRDAKKEKNGSLLVGSNPEGWMLSPAGLRWFSSLNLDSIIEPQTAQYRKDSIIENQETECVRLRSTRAYKLFTENDIDSVTLQDFYQFARVNEYYQTKTRKKRVAVVDNAVVGDNELENLWRFLKNKYGEEIAENV